MKQLIKQQQKTTTTNANNTIETIFLQEVLSKLADCYNIARQLKRYDLVRVELPTFYTEKTPNSDVLNTLLGREVGIYLTLKLQSL